MTSDRPYRKALSNTTATQEIVRVSGTQLDPDVVAVFLELHEHGLFETSIAGEHIRSTYPQYEENIISYRPKGSWL